MKVLITGASGYLGSKLAHRLANNGKTVHALVRSGAAEKRLQHANIKICRGEIMQKDSLQDAMQGCNQVYHAAAKTGAWDKDAESFYRVNIEGTRHVLDASIDNGIEKIVFTSTCGIIGPTNNGPLSEDHMRTFPFEIDYDLSKKKAEDLVIKYAGEGLQVVIASPSKIYGPGNISHSLMANAVIDTFLKKKIAFIPLPGHYQVCFAFLDDVVNGHLQAMEKGVRGEKYILGGTNISYFDFFNRIRTLSGNKGIIVQMPKGIIKMWAHAQELNYKLTKRPVRFPVKSVDHLFSNYTFSSQKAINELGYTITPLDEALTKTIQYLNQ
jgi:nucleoside-diphosphate-sugar epimerase